MLNGKYRELYNRLLDSIDTSRLFHDDLRLLAFGTDASFYRLLPKLVIRANDVTEVQHVLKCCSELEIPVTFRAGGTSLSGQTISESVLIMTDQGWKDYEILENSEKIRLEPGVVGAVANKALLAYDKKIGPDPASINSAMIGGIVANNAGGMCCGTVVDSYSTLASMTLLFADGTLLDTGDPDSVARFRDSHSDMLNRILLLKDNVLSNPALTERIQQKSRLKNTTGYTLKALLDFDDPIDIITHLMCGSEGTLGFIADITLHTVQDPANKGTSLILFPNIEEACKAVSILKSCPVDAVELMDRASLRSVEDKEGLPSYLKNLDSSVAALLVESRSLSTDVLLKQINEITSALTDIPTLFPIEFTRDSSEFNKLWDVRKGLFPSVSADRDAGTTVLIEDVAFPVSQLAEATLDLQSLFKKHGYKDAIIWGHALEGNLHFVLKQNFNVPDEITRYENFIQDLTHMVVKKYDGSLKAEHGTGRNMAPFVKYEWGKEAYEIMQDIKAIFDPNSLLNPGVILNQDKKIHLKNLKPLPVAHALVDKCIECGFCEVHCVSNHLTLSARQRIVVYREIAWLKATGTEPHRLAQLLNSYDYYGNQTCATDGLCALGCPVDIDTGQLIKELRHETISPGANRIAGWIAKNLDKVTAMARVGLNVVDGVRSILGSSLLLKIAKGMRKLSGNRIPLYTPLMPKGAKRITNVAVNHNPSPKVVYFPSCITRSMGVSKDYYKEMDLTRKTAELLHKAGYEILYPDNMNNLCCGMAFSSKGFKETGDEKAKELNEALLKITNQGEIPVLCDMNPCLYRMKETLDERLDLYEPIEFSLEFLTTRLKFEKKAETIAIHSVCSAKKMGLEEKFLQLANMCAENVVVTEANCCGFAGDRGFSFPELNEHGLRHLKEQIPESCQQGYSTSRTCEIGISQYSGITYKSILYLVDECTRPL